MTIGGSTEPRPAATVVLLRPGPDGPEVLLTRRPASMAFAANLHVFPGGKVDPADAAGPPREAGAGDSGPEALAAGAEALAAGRRLGDNLPAGAALAIHRAALRELREETAVELSGIDRLVPIAHWTTPRFMPRRFSTWFFVADLPPDAALVFEADEVVDHRWLTAAAALDQVAAGEIAMWVPTTSVLQRLIETGAATAAEVAARIRMTRVEPPRVVAEDAIEVRFAFGAVGALPGRRGETRLLGARDHVLVDPGDPSDGAVALIDATVERRRGAIAAIVLTRTDPDHAAAAEAIAIPREVPILVAPGAGVHLPYATRELADGEILPADVRLRVHLGPPGSGRLEVAADGSAGE